MRRTNPRYFPFRPGVVAVCTTMSATLALAAILGLSTPRTLRLELSARTWVVLNAYDTLARFILIQSTADPIDVSDGRMNTPSVRIAKADPTAEAKLVYPGGIPFRGIDEASRFWAGGISFGARDSVRAWGVTWNEDLTKSLDTPEKMKTVTPPPPVRYDLARFPLWPPALLLMIPVFLRVIQRVIQELRVPPFLCPACRYNLTGNRSGVCPECGTPVGGGVLSTLEPVPRLSTPTFLAPNFRLEGESLSSLSTFRILDANFNRGREALRVMEEYARFVLDDGDLTRAIKELRHDLAETLRGIISVSDGDCGDRSAPPTRGGATALVGARDIVGDVGREIGTVSEYDRTSTEDVVVAAGKRLSEALRVIEEYGKVLDPALGTAIERLRYRGYEVERRLAATITARERFGKVRLYVLLTESLCLGDWFETAEAALRGGAECLQLREKGLPDRELVARSKRLAELCRRYNALFIVNDRPDLAVAGGANGVHVGQEDIPVAAVRRIVPASMIVGVSTHTIEQAQEAIVAAPDYLAVGPMFDSPTKPQPHLAGPRTLAEVRALTSHPLVAIGGITAENAEEVLRAASCTLCVCQAVIRQPDVEAAARSLRSLLVRAHPIADLPSKSLPRPSSLS